MAKLHETGTLKLKDAKGINFRINAQNHGSKGFVYWIQNTDSGFWSRLHLGQLPAALSGVAFIDNIQPPGVLPFRPPVGEVRVAVGVQIEVRP